MAISLNAAGSWAYASSGSVTVTLPSHATGNMLLARVAYKSSAIATCSASTATSGWAKIGEFHDGTTNSGNGTGSVAVATFWKVAASASETNPVIDFSQTVTQVGHVALSYAKAAGELWTDPVGDGGGYAAGTAVSATIASHVSVTAADMVDFFYAARDDSTCTVPTITQASVTFDTVSEQPATAGTDTSGADGAYDGGYRLASSGTSSAAAVITGTQSTSESGSGWQTRLRVSVATDAPAELASGTGSSLQPSISVDTNAALASGTGTAYNATVQTGKDVDPGLASGTGAALQPSVAVSPNAIAAAAIGAAYNPSIAVEVNALLAAGTGTAYNATVETSSGTNAQAEVATGTGTAYGAAASVAPAGGIATGTGTAYNPAAGISPNALLASGTGTAYNATVTVGGGSPDTGGIPPRGVATYQVPASSAYAPAPPTASASHSVPES